MTKKRKPVPLTTRNKLYLSSYSHCAYPGCDQKLVTKKTEESDAAIVGEICHIYAAAENGPRPNPEMSADELNSLDNLILLCPLHHKIIDKQSESHPAEMLIEWKHAHESRNARLIRKGISQVRPDPFHHEVFPGALVNEEVERQLQLLKKSRFYNTYDKVRRAVEMGTELISGGLSGAEKTVRCKAIAWCARILSVTEKSDRAIEYLDIAKELGNCIEIDIAEAFLLSNKNDKNGALAILAKHQKKESNTASLMIVTTRDGLESGLDWMKKTNLDIEELDSDGKLFLVSNLLNDGQWERAIEISETLISDEDIENSPALLRFIAMAHLLQAIPEDFRALILSQIPFSANSFYLDDDRDGIETRVRAIDFFKKAAVAERELGCIDAATLDEDYALWLELRDPSRQEEAKARLEKALQSAASGLRLVSLAIDFGVDLDEEVIQTEIERQIALNGGYTYEAALARFSLAFIQKSEKGVVDYLDRYGEALSSCSYIEPHTILALKGEMLARSGQFERARVAIDQLKKAGGGEAKVSRLRRILEEAEGGDSLEVRISQFNLSEDLQDLVAVVDEFDKRKRYKELVYYAELLFDKTKSLESASRLAIAQFNNREYEEVIAFLEANSFYADQSPELQVVLAWSHYNLGHVSQVLEQLDKIPAEFRSFEIFTLQTNTALISGKWKSLSVLLAKKHEEITQLSPSELIGLARMAYQLNSQYAEEFLVSAVESGGEDAQILASAYFIASEVGIENSENVAGWLNRAAQLSGEDGPIRKMSLSEVLELKPQWDTNSSDVWNRLAHAQAPMFLAGQFLNKSLAELMLFPGLGNLSERDPRRRGAIPAYNGCRKIQSLVDSKVIGLDATALLTIGLLGLTEILVDSFERIYIPHSTMEWLFREKSKANFHQPSRIEKARELISLVSDGTISKLEPRVPKNSDLSVMIGDELAELLSSAKAQRETDQNIFVVRSSPVHHIGSLMNSEADLSAYSNLLCSCTSVIDKMAELGHLTDDEQNKAISFLQLHEKPWPNQPDIPEGATLYLDGLSVTHFMHIGLIEKLQSSDFKVLISEKEIDDMNALNSYARFSNQAQSTIEEIRDVISRGIEVDKVRLGRRNLPGKEEVEPEHPHPSYEAVALADTCDAVVVDDRFINRHGNVDSGAALAKAGTTLDLLQGLYERNILKIDEYRKHIIMLRRSCYFFIPLDINELMFHLNASEIKNNKFIETFGLRAIREYLLRVRMSDWLTLPEEAFWIESLFKTLNSAVTQTWESGAGLEAIIGRSDWLLQQFDLRGWAHVLVGDAGEEVGNTGRLAFVLMLASVPPDVSGELKDEYWRWVEERIVIPVKEEFPELYELIVQSQKQYFERTKELGINDEAAR